MKTKTVKTDLTAYNSREYKRNLAERKAEAQFEQSEAWRHTREYKRDLEIAELEEKLGFDLPVPKSEYKAERPIVGYIGTTSKSAFQPATLKPIYGSVK